MKPPTAPERTLLLLLAAVALLAPALAVGFGESRAGQVLERRVYDQWFSLRGPLPRPDEVVIVAIDLDAEAALGRWPWTRDRHAQLLRNLHEAGAAVVLFDVTFLDPFPAEDSIFRTAIDETGIAVLGAYADPRSTPRGMIWGLQRPAPLLADVPLGLVSIAPDGADAIVREYPLAMGFPTGRVAQLGVEGVLRYRGLGPEALVATPKGWELDGRPIPRGPAGGMLINFRGERGSIAQYSFLDVLDDGATDLGGFEFGQFLDLMDAGVFEGKIVLVGSTILEHQDYHPTPFREGAGAEVTEQTPGVEIHAHAIATLLAGDWLRILPGPIQYGWTFLLALLGVLAAARARGVAAAFLTLGLMGGSAAVAYLLFASQGLWLFTVTPALAAGLSFAGATTALFVVEEREKARIRGMFRQYVAESVVDELIRKPELLQLGGEERHLTVMFSDVAGFSSFSERLTPTALVELLNEYLTAMSDIVMEEGGIIDKYQGDALMAEFGAPVPVEDHALRGCRAALRMNRELASLRARWLEEGKPEMVARIGINTGRVLLGNLGSRRIMDYTVMGDSVNLASRLEGTGKFYDISITISEYTWAEVEGKMLARELDRIRVKGKEEPVTIYELLADAENDPPELQDEMRALITRFESALGLYKEARFVEALSAFQAVLEAYPEDGPSAIYEARCREFLADPPEAGWDGVYTMKSK